MVNENQYLIENKKPFETVQELEKYEIKKSSLSPVARGKVINKSGSNYLSESKGDYGPCKNSLCGCNCSSRECKCKNASMWIGDSNSSFLSHSASGRKWQKEIDPTDMDELALKLAGAKDVGASGQVSSSVFGYRDSGGELKVLSGTAGGEVSRSGIKGKLSADLYNVKSDGVQARLGLAADTGFSVEDGLEIKAVGFGFTVGDQIGISTPVGEIKVDKDKCVIQ